MDLTDDGADVTDIAKGPPSSSDGASHYFYDVRTLLLTCDARYSTIRRRTKDDSKDEDPLGRIAQRRMDRNIAISAKEISRKL